MANVSAFKRLKQRLMPNLSTTLLLKALSDCDDLLGEELIWPMVREAIIPAIYKSTPKRDKLIVDNKRAGRFLLMLIADYTEQQVISGHFHIYRGVLSFNGKSIKGVLDQCLSMLNENDWLDYDEYEERLASIEREIREVG